MSFEWKCYIPSNCDQNLWPCENAHRANVFFFLAFASDTHGPKKEKVWKVCSWGFCPAINIFFQCAHSFPRAIWGPRKDAPGSACYGDKLCHLWTVKTCFRFWEQPWLIRSTCKWLCNVKRKHVVAVSSFGVTQLSQCTGCRMRSVEESEEGASGCVTFKPVCYHVCHDNLR